MEAFTKQRTSITNDDVKVKLKYFWKIPLILKLVSVGLKSEHHYATSIYYIRTLRYRHARCKHAQPLFECSCIYSRTYKYSHICIIFPLHVPEVKKD